MKTWLMILITVIATGGISGVGTYYYLNNKNDKDISVLQKQIDDLKKPVAVVAPVTAETVTPAIDSTSGASADGLVPDPHYIVGWKQYSNAVYKYSIYLPSDYVATNGSTDANKAFSLAVDDKWMFAVSVSKNTGNKSLDAVVKEITDGKISTSEPAVTAIITDIKLDEIAAKKYSIPGWGDVGNAGMVVLSNGNIYHLSGFDQNFQGAAVLANVALSFQFTK